MRKQNLQQLISSLERSFDTAIGTILWRAAYDFFDGDDEGRGREAVEDVIRICGCFDGVIADVRLRVSKDKTKYEPGSE